MWTSYTDDKKQPEKLWLSTYRALSLAQYRWLLVKGPLAVTVATLIDLGIKPIQPTVWLVPELQCILKIDFNASAVHRIEHEVAKIISARQWSKAAQ